MPARPRLTEAQVLSAVPRACSPDTAYIADTLARDGLVPWRKAGSHSAMLLRRLKRLAADGKLKRSAFPNGYYGYRWDLTESGRLTLQPEASDGEPKP